MVITNTLNTTETNHANVNSKTGETNELSEIKKTYETLYKEIMHILLDKIYGINQEVMKIVFSKITEMKDLVKVSLIQNSNLKGHLTSNEILPYQQYYR